MTYTEQAIQKAVEGGWAPVDFTDMPIDQRGILFSEDMPANSDEAEQSGYVYFYDTEYPDQGWYASMLIELAFLDLNFWKSLGLNERTVTLDLSEKTFSVMGRPWNRKKQKAVYVKKTPNRWKTEWHRLIDYLAEGKSVEDYFKSIL